MKKFELSKEGLPLIAYLPDEKDQIPIPPAIQHSFMDRGPEDDGFDSDESNYSHHAVHVNQPTMQVWAYGATLERFDEITAKIRSTITEWEQKARDAGHEYAYIAFDGANFWPVYRRLASLDEIVKLKEAARYIADSRKEKLERAKSEQTASEEFLKKLGEK